MEGITVEAAKEILGKNFIGVEAVTAIADKLNLLHPSALKQSIPAIPYTQQQLLAVADTHLLFLFIPFTAQEKALTLLEMRSFFGMDPNIQEPCFYNQDWYVKEKFVNESLATCKWFLLRKELINESRGKGIDENTNHENLPSALVCAYAFFAHYFNTGEYLWKTDFVWCSDTDANGDRVYVGRYFDPQAIAKNGFSIHRHLRLSKMYGSIEVQ